MLELNLIIEHQHVTMLFLASSVLILGPAFFWTFRSMTCQIGLDLQGWPSGQWPSGQWPAGLDLRVDDLRVNDLRVNGLRAWTFGSMTFGSMTFGSITFGSMTFGSMACRPLNLQAQDLRVDDLQVVGLIAYKLSRYACMCLGLFFSVCSFFWFVECFPWQVHMAQKRMRKPSPSRSLSSAHRARGRSPTRSPKSLDRHDDKHEKAADRSPTKSPGRTNAGDNQQVGSDSVPEKSRSPSSKERGYDRGRSKAPVPERSGDRERSRSESVECPQCGQWVMGPWGLKQHQWSSKRCLQYHYWNKGYGWQKASTRAHKAWKQNTSKPRREPITRTKRVMSESRQRSMSPAEAKKPRRSRSPAKAESPKRSRLIPKATSPRRSKSPVQAKKLRHSRSPAKAHSPRRSKSSPKATSPRRSESFAKAKSPSLQKETTRAQQSVPGAQPLEGAKKQAAQLSKPIQPKADEEAGKAGDSSANACTSLADFFEGQANFLRRTAANFGT